MATGLDRVVAEQLGLFCADLFYLPPPRLTRSLPSRPRPRSAADKLVRPSTMLRSCLSRSSSSKKEGSGDGQGVEKGPQPPKQCLAPDPRCLRFVAAFTAMHRPSPLLDLARWALPATMQACFSCSRRPLPHLHLAALYLWPFPATPASGRAAWSDSSFYPSSYTRGHARDVRHSRSCCSKGSDIGRKKGEEGAVTCGEEGRG